MLLLFSFVLGAVIGSFLNVCIYRLPLRQSVVMPPSHCFACNEPIAWYDNIPIISFLLLGGKCRNCKTPIAYQYPLVELLTGITAVACTLKWGYSIDTVAYFVFVAALIVVAFIDLKNQIIPDLVSLPGIVCGLVFSLLSSHLTFIDSLLGVVIGGGSLLLVAAVYYLLTKQEGMGIGDVKLLGMIGSFLGWKSILFIVMMASLTGALVGIAVMMVKRKSRKYAIPFGPFLSLGAVSYLFFGREITTWYLHCHLWVGQLFR